MCRGIENGAEETAAMLALRRSYNLKQLRNGLLSVTFYYWPDLAILQLEVIVSSSFLSEWVRLHNWICVMQSSSPERVVGCCLSVDASYG